MTTHERLEQQHRAIEEQYDLSSEKITRLRKARAIENDVSTQIKLEEEIQEVELEREKLAQELSEVERSIAEPGTFPSWEGAGVGKREGKRPITYSPRPQVKHFFDRKQILDQLITELRDAQKIMVMVDGIAGIGKTSLAVKVTEAVESEFAGVYYKKCAPDTDADQLLAELAYFLGEYGDQTLAGVFEYAAQQAYKVKALIEALAKQRFLLLFDDVHELLNQQTQTIGKPDLEAFFAAFLTQPHQAKILLVSRIRPVFHQAQMSQAKNPLGPIEQQAGIEFLRQMQVEENADLLQQAYQFTGGHPLTMELLATLTETMPLEDILADQRLFWSDTIVADKLLQKIYTTLMPEEQTLILKISILPRPVSNKVICALGDSPNTMQILKDLVRKSLVTFDQKLKVYRLHDLVRDFHRLQLTEQQKREYHLKAAAYYESLEFNKDKPTFEQVQQRLEARYHYFQAGDIEKAAKLLLEVTEFYREWGYLQQCQTFLEEILKAIEQSTQTNERQLLNVDLLVELSWIDEVSDGNDKAIIRCQQAEKILKSFEDEQRVGNVSFAMGRFNQQMSQWEHAKTYLHQAFEIKKRTGDTVGIVKILGELRSFYMDLGQVEEVERLSREGIEVCQQQQDGESHANVLVNILGATYSGQYRTDAALSMYEESLSLRKPSNFLDRAISLRLIGDALRQKKMRGHAVEKYEESLELAKKGWEALVQAYAYRGIGDVYRDEGKIDEALQKYEEALTIASQTTNLLGKSAFLVDIGASYRDAGKLERALELYEECLQLRKELHDLTGVATVLNHIGLLYFLRYSNLEKGLEYFTASLELRRRLGGSFRYVSWMRSNIACVYKRQGKLDEAQKIWEENLEMIKKQGRESAQDLNYLGSVYYVKREYQKAFESFKESFRICEDRKIPWLKSFTLTNLGKIYKVFGDYEKALAAFKESIELKTAFAEKALPMTGIADAYFRQGKLAEAMAKCEESLALSRTYGGRIQAGVTLHLMGKIRLSAALKTGLQEHYADALQYVQEAVTIFEETGSRHLPEAEETLKKIQAGREHG